MQSYHSQSNNNGTTGNQNPIRVLVDCCIIGSLPSAFYHVFSFTGENDLRIKIWAVMISAISVGVFMIVALSKAYRGIPRKPVLIITSLAVVWASSILILFALGLLFTFLGISGHSPL